MGMAPFAVMGVAQVLQTISEVQQARSQAKAFDAEAKSIKYQAQFEEKQSRRQSAMLIGKQIATGAAAGVDITSGSPLFMELDSVRQAELEALNIRNQGRNAAAGRKFAARMTRAQIPGIIMGGVAKLAGTGAQYGQHQQSQEQSSMLSQWMAK